MANRVIVVGPGGNGSRLDLSGVRAADWLGGPRPLAAQGSRLERNLER
jgi:hypothetical protein